MHKTALEVSVHNSNSPHTNKVWPYPTPEGTTSLHVESHPTDGVRGWIRTLQQTWRARRAVRTYQHRGLPIMVRSHGAGRASVIATALVHPHPVVIVYGSEVVDAAQRPGAVRWLTTWTLRRAQNIVVATDAMFNPIEQLVPGSFRKTKVVPMPVAWDRFAQAVQRQGDPRPTIVSMRRISPLYRVVEIVGATTQMSTIRVNLFRGVVDETSAYLMATREAAKDSRAQVEVLEQFFDVDGLIRQYSRADVAVSIPDHDQMSVGMLEAMAAGCIAVITDLPSYRFLHGLQHVFWVQSPAAGPDVERALGEALELLQTTGKSQEARQERARLTRMAYESSFPAEQPTFGNS